VTGAPPDRGAVDVSLEMLFGMVGVLMVMLLLFEVGAYWHASNVFDDAAADGARIAASYDGSCDDGIARARASVDRQAGRWASILDVGCTDAAMVTVTVGGRTPGVLAGSFGFRASATQSEPRER
jgi:hypothetical protein